MRVRYIIALYLICSSYIYSQDYSLIGETGPEGFLSDKDTSFYVQTFFDHRFNYEKSAFGATQTLVYSPQNPENIDFQLHTAYADLRITNQILLTIGKFRVPWTKGVYFTALDKLNPPKDSLDIQSPEEGFWGGAVTWTPTMNTTLLICADVSDDAESGSLYDSPKTAGYVSIFFGNVDLFVSGIYQYDQLTLAGAGASFSLFEFVVYAEVGLILNNNYLYPGLGGYSTKHEKTFILEDTPLLASSGIQRLFYFGDTTLSFTMEYLFTEAAYTPNETKEHFYLIATGFGQEENIPGIGKHHIVCSAGIDILDLLTLENTVLINPADSSMAQSHNLTLITIPNTDITGGITFFYGDASTEIGFYPYNYIFNWGITYHF